MMQILQQYFGSSVSTDTMELTAAVLLIGFSMLVISSIAGILNRIFR